MIRLEINDDKRIYLGQYVVDGPVIRQLQTEVAKTVSFEPMESDRFHLTLFHYGKPTDLYEALAGQTRIPKDEIKSRLTSHLENGVAQSYFERSLPVEGYGVDIFGNETNHCLVLRLRPSEKVLAFRQSVLFGFTEFLRGAGVANPQSFMKSNVDLVYQSQEKYNPHVTIGTLRDGHGQLPELKREVVIRLEAPRLFNIKLTNEAV